MTDTTHHQDHCQPPLDRYELLACPNCSSSLSSGRVSCSICGYNGSIRNGVPSFVPEYYKGKENPTSNLHLNQLASEAESRHIRDATNDILDNDKDSFIISEIYDIQRDAWWPFARDHITGDVLDVHAGFGRRSMLLAELADTVYAVDSHLSKLRITGTRDDYESSDRVFPVHSTEDGLPFAADSFDTIVADLTTPSDQKTLARLSRLQEHLNKSGSMIFVADGWPRKLGLTDFEGFDHSGTNKGKELFPATADGYRSLVSEFGFDQTSVYALFPTASNPMYVFDVENDYAIETLTDLIFDGTGILPQSVKKSLGISNKLGILKRCFPSFLVVCSNDSINNNIDLSNSVLKSGRSRSVLLDSSDQGVEQVWKIPNRDGHRPLTERENSILSYLKSSEEPIIKTLPNGNPIDIGPGTARVEKPVTGQTITDAIDYNADSFSHVLNLGFDWLIEFQQTFGGDTLVRSPAEIRKDLRFEPAGVEPPNIDEPVRTFFTPVHGDFMSQNIYLNRGSVSTVIDWEYGALEASPIIDAGFFLLETASKLVGGIKDGFRTVLCSQNEYSERAQESIHRYCDALDIPYHTFKFYLPAVYIHRLKLDWRYDFTSTYLPKMSNRAEIANYIFSNTDQMTVF